MRSQCLPVDGVQPELGTRPSSEVFCRGGDQTGHPAAAVISPKSRRCMRELPR